MQIGQPISQRTSGRGIRLFATDTTERERERERNELCAICMRNSLVARQDSRQMIVLPLLDHKHAIGPSMRIGFPLCSPLLSSIGQSALASKRNQRNWSQIKNAKITTIITTTTAAERTQIKSSKSHLLVLISRLSKWSAKWENNTKQEQVQERRGGGVRHRQKLFRFAADVAATWAGSAPSTSNNAAGGCSNNSSNSSKAEQDLSGRQGKDEGWEEGEPSLSCHCYDCCNTLWRGDYNVWLLCY